MSSRTSVTLLDYGAGNVRSVRNALHLLGCTVKDVHTVDDILSAERLVFPGVGAFPQAMRRLSELGYIDALKQYVRSNRPFFGMCLGMQVLFEYSTETKQNMASQTHNTDDRIAGLGLIPGLVRKFQCSEPVPHIGWNSLQLAKQADSITSNAWTHNLFTGQPAEKYYFVHSYCAIPDTSNSKWTLTYTDYGHQRFISSVAHENILATQFHPEKSSTAGLNLLYTFVQRTQGASISKQLSAEEHKPEPGNTDQQTATPNAAQNGSAPTQQSELARRIIACLDVRANDNGDLVVTKGDQYDVRETTTTGNVRNLGKPVELAKRYYEEGADEIVFLNITSFRTSTLSDQPTLHMLQAASQCVFVPLTIGGGIRDYTDESGKHYSALDVAGAYFRAGADKVSIGSDAVIAAEQYYSNNKQLTGKSSIEQISNGYGAQAVVVSVDPKRVYVQSPSDTTHQCVELPASTLGPNNERYCWYQCTVKGGRETRDMDVVQLAQACEALGAGELLVNSIDADGSKQGFDVLLLQQISKAVSIPVIASSGAGTTQHFSDVFQQTSVNAALAAGIFHRREVPIQAVKEELVQKHIPTRVHVPYKSGADSAVAAAEPLQR